MDYLKLTEQLMESTADEKGSVNTFDFLMACRANLHQPFDGEETHSLHVH